MRPGIFFWHIIVSFYLYTFPDVGLLGYVAVLSLVFWGTSITVLYNGCKTFIPINNKYRGFSKEVSHTWPLTKFHLHEMPSVGKSIAAGSGLVVIEARG